MPTRPKVRRLWTSLLLFLASLAAAPLFASPVLAAEENRPAGITDLPTFRHQGVVLDYKDLKYNPCNDVIIPSVIATDQLQKPLRRYYMYYAPHNAPGGICLAYADSPAGPWKEYGTNPLITRKWSPHYKVSHVSGPHAIWIDEQRKLFLYYHGENDVTRIASTTDGIHFHVHEHRPAAEPEDRVGGGGVAGEAVGDQCRWRRKKKRNEWKATGTCPVASA